MDQTLRLLRLIGSPFAPPQTFARNEDESLELYDCAVKNKIGLLYLETLRKNNVLNKYEPEYENLKKRQAEHLDTAIRISNLLNNQNVEYAVIKSLMPFPFVPNDVDILIFDLANRFEEIINTAKNSGYDVIGEAALEVMIHDARNEKHKDPTGKDIYDVDLYRELGASYIIYLDKSKLKKHVTELWLNGEKIKILKPEAELATVLVHSILPEQIFTLHLYYTTLHYLSKMNGKNIDDFITIAKENDITFAVKTVTSIIANIHEAAHGFIPEKLKIIGSELGKNKSEINRHQKKFLLKTPYIYGFATVIITLLEKLGERKAAKSILRQMLKMTNPKTVRYVARVVAERRRRETY